MTGDSFVKNYTDSFDYMTKDWITLIEKLFKIADDMLFKAKPSGKNQVIWQDCIKGN